MEKENKFCQSCGMPIKQDQNLGGTEKNGEITKLYCSYCYRNGKFIQPNFSAQDMQLFCIKAMSDQGTNKFFAWLMTRGIPKLKRWKK